MLVAYVLNRSSPADGGPETPDRAPRTGWHRVLVLANETMARTRCSSELRDVHAETGARVLRLCPANPVDTGQAEVKGAVCVWEATGSAAQERLDATLATLRATAYGPTAELGDYRPLVALDEAVAEFQPDR